MSSGSTSSLSTSAYYNGIGDDDQDSADSYIARILLSLQIPSSSEFEFSRRNLPPERWGTTKKRTELVDELFSRFDSLQSKSNSKEEGGSFDGAVKVLKFRYKLNRKIAPGIKAFKNLRSKGLNGDQMLKVLDGIFNNGRRTNKRKIIEELNDNPAPIIMKKQKIKESAKFNNISELIGEVSIVGNYEQVFSSFIGLLD